MYSNLFKHIDIDPKNVHILDGNAQNLQMECVNFEEMIKDAGGVELFIGGEVMLAFIAIVHIGMDCFNKH